MAQWRARVEPARFGVRIASALILAPPVLAAVYLGAPYMQALVIVGGAIAAWEWMRLCGGGRLDAAGWCAVAWVPAALALWAASNPAAVALAALGAAGIAVWRRARGQAGALWSATGVAYLTLAGFALIWLRELPGEGRATVFWLLALIAATDTGGYLAGRAIGGPKLAPGISPHKTWAGLAGAVAAAAAVGAAAGALWPGPAPLGLALASAGLALVAQAGDLFISRLKRRFGAKDSSQLIPGHGGLLDRIDGLLAASIFVSLVTWYRSG